jgi:hypothetical protein
VGKPRIGRPRGGKNAPSSFDIIMKLYDTLHYEQGHSFMEAGALVRRLLGEEVTMIMVQTWRAKGRLNQKKSTRPTQKRNNSGRFVPQLL